MAFVNNFATSFRWCDYIFGTDTKYREYKARVALAKSAAEREGLEQKIFDETKADGLRAEKEAEMRGDVDVAWVKKKVQ